MDSLLILITCGGHADVSFPWFAIGILSEATAAIIAGIVAAAAATATGVTTAAVGSSEADAAQAEADAQEKLAISTNKETQAYANKIATWDRRYQWDQGRQQREDARLQKAEAAKQMNKQDFDLFANKLIGRAAQDIGFKDAIWSNWGR